MAFIKLEYLAKSYNLQVRNTKKLSTRRRTLLLVLLYEKLNYILYIYETLPEIVRTCDEVCCILTDGTKYTQYLPEKNLIWIVTFVIVKLIRKSHLHIHVIYSMI